MILVYLLCSRPGVDPGSNSIQGAWVPVDKPGNDVGTGPHLCAPSLFSKLARADNQPGAENLNSFSSTAGLSLKLGQVVFVLGFCLDCH